MLERTLRPQGPSTFSAQLKAFTSIYKHLKGIKLHTPHNITLPLYLHIHHTNTFFNTFNYIFNYFLSFFIQIMRFFTIKRVPLRNTQTHQQSSMFSILSISSFVHISSLIGTTPYIIEDLILLSHFSLLLQYRKYLYSERAP